MSYSSKEIMKGIVNKLQSINQPAFHKAFIGLDGYLDRIIRPVKKQGVDQPLFYETITDFAMDCKEAAGVSRQFELFTQEVKLGGNAPIFAKALSSLGCEVACMGNFGEESLHPEFEDLNKSCHLISLGDPAETIALEFRDGKLILSELSSLDSLDWEKVRSVSDENCLSDILNDSYLFALVDWCNLKHATEIWEGLLKEFVSVSNKNNRIFFFDLADPSKKSDQDIKKIFQVIAGFRPFGKVYLGLNENETRKAHRALIGESVQPDLTLEAVCEELFEKIAVDAVLTHPVDKCIITTNNGAKVVPGKVVAQPRISTGGGDNLNSGFCFGLMNGFSLEESACLGMANSGAYVQNGHSPDIHELKTYLSEWVG
jgi:hypothetical protein